MEENVSFRLPKKRVLVKPIIREGKWLDKGHSGNFMYDNAKMFITVPKSRETGHLIDPLTVEEREFFEHKQVSGLDFSPGDLSIFKKPNLKENEFPYWYDYQYQIIKNQGVVNEDTVLAELDLSNPIDYINYKVLLANAKGGGVVAPNWDSRYDHGTYRIVLVESDFKAKEQSSRAIKLGKAFRFFNSIMNSQVEMYELLSVYWLENRKASRPAPDSDINWLQGEIQTIIDKDLDTFLRLIETDYEERLLVHNAMRAGAISIESGMFLNVDRVPVGNTITDVIMYYKDERHQEEKLRLLALIESNKN